MLVRAALDAHIGDEPARASLELVTREGGEGNARHDGIADEHDL